MVFIECCDKFFVFASKSRVIVFDNKLANEKVNNFELKIPEFNQNKKSLINNALRKEENPLCGKFSVDCNLFAISDIYKRLIIWKTGHLVNNDDKSWEISRKFYCDKKVVQLCFFSDNSLLVGDKSCDVYRYDLKNGERQLLFGHLSLLLQMRISPKENFIITCDRDEKVRVTNYPSVYNIQTFLLGHREFVSCCAFVGSDRLVTGSGDSTIRLWEIINGKELFSFDFSKDERLNKLKNGSSTENDIRSISKFQSRSIENDYNGQKLAIKNVFYFPQSNRLVVIFFNLSNLITFVVNEQIILEQIISIPSTVLDAITYQNQLYIQTINDGLISFEFRKFQLIQIPNYFLASINNYSELSNFNRKELVDDYLRSLYKFAHPTNMDSEYDEKKRKKLK